MIASALKLSLLVTGIAIIWIALLGSAIGLLLSRTKFKGRELLDAFLTLPMVLPPTVTGYYLVVLWGREGIIGRTLETLTGFSITFHWTGAVIAAIVVAIPLMIRAARVAFDGVPRELEEAAYMLGKSRIQTFRHITLPLARPGLLVGIILSFARALGEFGATLMVAGNIPDRTQTMPLAIYDALISGNDRDAQLLVLMLTLFSLTVIYLTNRLGKRTVNLR